MAKKLNKFRKKFYKTSFLNLKDLVDIYVVID